MALMISEPESYFRGLVPPREPLLAGLEEEAARESVPIVGPVVGRLLFILAGALGARAVLELGTAIGYSAIFLARAVAALQGRVVSLERDPGMAERARGNLRRAGVEAVVEVREGDALALLEASEESYDLIFLDIDKESYLPALASCHRLLRPGGLLVADNTGFAGAADFNQALLASSRWAAVNLLCLLPQHSPERDGLALALRLG